MRLAPDSRSLTNMLLHRAESVERGHILRPTFFHHPQDHLELTGRQAEARKIVQDVEITQLRKSLYKFRLNGFKTTHSLVAIWCIIMASCNTGKVLVYIDILWIPKQLYKVLECAHLKLSVPVTILAHLLSHIGDCLVVSTFKLVVKVLER